MDALDLKLPSPIAGWRAHPLDGALLLFDRDSGNNALVDGEETAHLERVAPRVVQFALTNRCNLACGFCSRDKSAESRWTADSAFEYLAALAAAGVLEVAFGGGEPFVFPGAVDLVRRLYRETSLAVSLTTNGLLLDDDRLRSIRGHVGQVRVSLYEDNDWRATLERLVRHRVRFGVNLLVTPERVDALEETVVDLVGRGCADILLLSYNGSDEIQHLDAEATERLANRVARLSTALRGRAEIKLDVCWGERMQAVPQLFEREDCGAGVDFLVITSDKHVAPCSFHDVAIPAPTAADALRIWREHRAVLVNPAREPGCARAAGCGLCET